MVIKMSKVSIEKNNLAVLEIGKAITNYNNALTSIKRNNNNSKTDEIIRLINQNIENLNETKEKIENINGLINKKLKELENSSGE